MREPLGEGPRGRLVEQIGAVLQDRVDPVGGPFLRTPFEELEGQVGLGGPGADQQRLRLQARQPHRGIRRVVQREHGLEQRVPGQRPAGCERVDQGLEGQVLVGVGGQVRGAYAVQQLPEGRVAGQVGAQHQGVDEQADELVQRRVRASRDGRSERDVLARAQLGQQGGERRLEHHEGAHALRPGQVADRRVQGGVDTEADLPALVRGGCGPRPVGRQLQLVGKAVQRLAPVGELLVRHGREQLALPQGVVRVLHRQWRPHRGPARTARLVGLREIAAQRAHRPAVGSDVVHHDQQHVLLVREPEQLRPQRQFGRQVEAAPRRRPHRVLTLRGDRQVHPHRLGVHDLLTGAPVRVRVAGAQRLMAYDDVPHRRTQGGHVQGSPQADGDRDVVRGTARLQLREEPEPLLGGGEGKRVRAHGRRRSGPGLPGVRDAGREGGRGRCVEDRADRQIGAERRPDPAGEPGGEQRVAAEFEEAVVRTHGRGQPEHLAEHLAQQLLLRRARRTGRGARTLGGRGQQLAVDLAVRRERQRVHRHVQGGHHVRGQALGQVRAQCPRSGRTDGVGHQLRTARQVLARHDRRL